MPDYRETAVDDPAARELLDEYFARRSEGFTGGGYTVMQPDPARFRPPAGVFLVVEDEGRAVGCGGIRMLGPARAEVKHLYLREETRGRGWGRLLLQELERRAVRSGATEIVLDTNASLVAAGSLYRSSGYEEIEPYNDNPNATHWFLKTLG